MKKQILQKKKPIKKPKPKPIKYQQRQEKVKGKKVVPQDDEDEEKEILSIMELDDLCATLWYDYFEPEKPLDRKSKMAVMEAYNEAANSANKARQFKAHIILTPSTRWVRDENESKKFKNRIEYPGAGSDKRPNHLYQDLSVSLHDQGQNAIPQARSNTSKINDATSHNSAKQTEPKGAIKRQENSNGLGIVEQILELHKSGKSNKDIVALGFNKNTVNRQVSDYRTGKSKYK